MGSSVNVGALSDYNPRHNALQESRFVILGADASRSHRGVGVQQGTCLRFAAIALLASSCGGQGAGGASGSPTAPSPVSAQPATVNVTGHWTGQESHAQGSGMLTLDMMQTAAQVTGTVSGFGTGAAGLPRAGPFAGTVSGNTLSFTFSYGHMGNGCGNAISGTATIGPNVLTGTFNGKDCTAEAVTNGNMTLSLDGGRTAAPPISGTWEGAGAMHSNIGGGTWTWAFSQSGGDVLYGGNFTGSIIVMNNALGLTSGSVSGTVSNTFPGPASSANFTANLSGRCPVTLIVTANIVRQANGLIALGVGTQPTATTCNGPVPISGFSLVRVSDSTSLPSPPALNLTGNWSGPSTNSFESGTLTLQLTQTGTFVNGTGSLARSDVTRGCNIQASLSGTTLTFTINIGAQGGCPTTVGGTAQVSSTSIDGTYSGTSCQGSVSNGRLTLSRQ